MALRASSKENLSLAGGHSSSQPDPMYSPGLELRHSLRPCHSVGKPRCQVVRAVWSEMRPGLGELEGPGGQDSHVQERPCSLQEDSLAVQGTDLGVKTIWGSDPGPPLPLGLTFSSFPGLSPRLLIHDVLVLGASLSWGLGMSSRLCHPSVPPHLSVQAGLHLLSQQFWLRCFASLLISPKMLAM